MFEIGSYQVYKYGNFFQHGSYLKIVAYNPELDAYQVEGSTVWVPSTSFTSLKPIKLPKNWGTNEWKPWEVCKNRYSMKCEYCDNQLNHICNVCKEWMTGHSTICGECYSSY